MDKPFDSRAGALLVAVNGLIISLALTELALVWKSSAYRTLSPRASRTLEVGRRLTSRERSPNTYLGRDTPGAFV